MIVHILTILFFLSPPIYCLLRIKDRAQEGKPLVSLLYSAVVLVHVVYIGNLAYTNFNTYACRSAQSEAIKSLNEIYRLQQAYHQAHRSYAKDLETLRFKPEKYSRYEYVLGSKEEFGITIELPQDGFLAFAEQARGGVFGFMADGSPKKAHECYGYLSWETHKSE